MGPAPEASGIAVVGDVVNTASRLADLAPAGTVLVEEAGAPGVGRGTRSATDGSGARHRRREVGAGRGVRGPERPAPRSRRGERSPWSGPSSWIGKPARAALGGVPSYVRKDRRAGRDRRRGRPGRGRRGWPRSSQAASRRAGHRRTFDRVRDAGRPCRRSPAAIGELAGISPGGSATPPSRRRIQGLAERVATGDE